MLLAAHRPRRRRADHEPHRTGRAHRKRKAKDEPRPSWEQLLRAPVRTVRLHELTAMTAAATEAGLPRLLEPERFSEADPGAGHLIWARFRCHPTNPDVPHFYRCAVRF